MKPRIIFIILTLLYFTIGFTFYAKADEKSCLAEAVYFEARSESFVAQLAVGNVILERTKSDTYPDTICEVVHQGYYWKDVPIRNRCQFSYWCDGKPERIANMEAYRMAASIAELVLAGVIVEHTAGATHYHATYVSPEWSHHPHFEVLGQVGSHIFYVQNRSIGN